MKKTPRRKKRTPKKIDWNAVDLSWPSDEAIAQDLGVSRQTVHLQRKKRGIEKKEPEPVDWAAVDWRFSDKEISKNVGRSIRHVANHRPKEF